LAQLLGNPGLEDWKRCILDKPAEEKLSKEFKSGFAKYDFTLE